MGDSFTFYCSADASLPEPDRAALTLSRDGDDVTVTLSTCAGDAGRSVYLAPDMAANLARVLNSIAEDDGEDGPPPAEPMSAEDVRAMLGCLAVLAVVTPVVCFLLALLV